jgi:fructose-specific phosphotransferase system IIA component
MRMSEFIAPEAVISEVQGTTKESVIREMVQSLHSAGHIKGSDPEELVRSILKREQLGSTGIGRGVAIPHAKHSSVDRPIATVAISPKGLDFDSLDGEPVHVLVLLVSPQNSSGPHLRALETVSRSLRNESFVANLRRTKTREEINRLLDSLDGEAPSP